jgi:hypothetical protein
MEALLGFALILALVVLFDGLALVSGVDSRDTATDHRNPVWPAVLGTH